jgi:cell division GTPase FtsZ
VFYGQVFDDALEDRFNVTVIATGFPPARREPARLALSRRMVRDGEPAAARPASHRPAVDLILNDDDLRRPAYLRRVARKLA